MATLSPQRLRQMIARHEMGVAAMLIDFVPVKTICAVHNVSPRYVRQVATKLVVPARSTLPSSLHPSSVEVPRAADALA